MKATRIEIVRLRTYFGYAMTYQGMADRDQEHMMFLFFWLNKFIFPNANKWGEVGLHASGWSPSQWSRCSYRAIYVGMSLSLSSLDHHQSTKSKCLWSSLDGTNVAGVIFPRAWNNDDVSATALAISFKRSVSTEEYFVFFRECRQTKRGIWLCSLTCDHPWFAIRGFHQAPTHWKDLTITRAIVHANRGISCLSNRGLFFGGIHTDKRCQYGVEAYNPQFVSRQFGFVQAIPELRYSSVIKGSSWRNMDMTPIEVSAIRTAGRTRSKSVRVPSCKPTLLNTPAFHEF